ncbi:hypothetical protein, partial [uncultured Duncaniella sp.]|uniref:hypothetical protein n=1 Tax=uncultured Duncaniella sp. TaxID=2768039 RepID=UPI0026758A00
MVAQCKCAILRILPSLFTQILLDFVPLLLRIIIHVSFTHITGHIVHGERGYRLYSGIRSRSGNRHSRKPPY